MNDTISQSTQVYHCIYCGPCLALMVEDDSLMIVHRETYHPADYAGDDEDNPQ